MAAPGGLDQHYGIVAITPALLLVLTAMAVALVPPGRGVRILLAVGIVPAIALQVLLLIPGGIAWRCRGEQVGGLVAVDPVAVVAGLVLAIAAALVRGGWARGGPSAWCLRLGLALGLPLVMAPPLILVCEEDLGTRVGLRALRWGCLVCLTAAAWWWPLGATAMAWILVAATTGGRWRVLATVLAVVILAGWGLRILAEGLSSPVDS